MVQSYYDPNLFKINTSSENVYNILKAYRKQYHDTEVITKNLKNNSYRNTIINKEIPEDIKPTFIEVEKKKEARYFPNPFKNFT